MKIYRLKQEISRYGYFVHILSSRTHQKNTYNILIEAQGQQHITPIRQFGGEEQFQKQKEHDKRKRDYAEANGYKLLEIWYYDYDRIEEILNKELEVG